MRKGTFNFNQEIEEKIKDDINETLDESINHLEKQLSDLKQQKTKLADENADLKEVLDGFKIPKYLGVEITPTNHKQWLKYVITFVITTLYAVLFNIVFDLHTLAQFTFYIVNVTLMFYLVFGTISKFLPEYKVKIGERS